MDNGYSFLGKLRGRLYKVLFGFDSRAGKIFDLLVMLIILLSIILVMIESVPSLNNTYGHIFQISEWVFTILFTLEYLLRLFSEKKPSRYAFSFLGIVDFIALLPNYVMIIFTGGSYLVIIRALRLLRISRILKLGRYMREANFITDALLASRFKIIFFLVVVFILTIFMGTAMYLIEGAENGFESIPRSIYWAIVTITTVGYGDIVPKTVVGQFIAALIMLMGYSIIAVPTGIISAEMNNKKESHDYPVCKYCHYKTGDNSANYCPKCGKKYK